MVTCTLRLPSLCPSSANVADGQGQAVKWGLDATRLVGLLTTQKRADINHNDIASSDGRDIGDVRGVLGVE